MFYDTLKCVECDQDKICVLISTYDVNDPMRVPRIEAHCTDCLHGTYLDILDGIEFERKNRVYRIK